MYCENCGNNVATTYIKRVINGIKTEKHLCSKCAVELGFTNQSGSFSNMLTSMFGDVSGIKIADTKRCSCCNSSFADIAKSGKVGCPKCYNEFINELLPYIKRIHGNVKHIGKIPNMLPLAVTNEKDKLSLLKDELSILVKNEEFEKAAKIRDQIRSIEDGVNKNE